MDRGSSTCSSTLLLGALLGVACAGGADHPPAQAPATDAAISTFAQDATVADATPAASDATACTPGVLGCSCSAGDSCSGGHCADGICVSCTPGTDGCACRSNDSCSAGLKCSDGVCATCPVGERDCPCLTDGSCADPLVCVLDVCTSSACTAGTIDCPCRRESPACEGALSCGSTGVCEACAPDVPGCACEAGSCGGGLFCDPDSGTCRALRRCSSQPCTERQLCTDRVDADALCESACSSGYAWNPATKHCDPCAGGDCTAEGACKTGQPDGPWAGCRAQLRECDQSGDQASCGACISDAQEQNGECVPRVACGSQTCQADEYCVGDPSTQSFACQRSPCEAPLVADASGACTRSCPIDCTGAGYTGRVWPYVDRYGACVCETVSGFYIEPGGTSGAVLCDADRDGWVKQTAGAAVFDHDGPSFDRALWNNRRCSIATVSSVLLQDEYGGQLRVRSCNSGLIPDSLPCDSELPMRLLESERNDVELRLVQSDSVPAFGERSRKPQAAELNALTKGCTKVITDADYDDDGTSDFLQAQQQPSAFLQDLDDQRRLKSFAHFMELYASYYEAPASGDGPGTLVIRERSRCQSSFPLHYAQNDFSPNVNNGTYWRNCQRRRDPAYSPQGSLLGLDFAQWSGDTIPGPATVADIGWPDRYERGAADPLPAYGLCALAGRNAVDGQFRGLNHASQFKCIAWTGAATDHPFNRCRIKTCEADDLKCASTRVVSGTTQREPVVECAVAEAPVQGELGWHAIPYARYGAVLRSDAGTVPVLSLPPGTPNSLVLYDSMRPEGYERGCINEDIEWGAKLCPRADTPMGDSTATFGRVSCSGSFSGYVWSPYSSPVGSSDDYFSELVFDYGLWQ